MKNKFTPSINIERDFNSSVDYIPTPNSERVIKLIDSDFKSGIHSFSIIGSYGSGKSSFLWALQDQLLNHRKHFDSRLNLNGKNEYDFINLVGNYSSLESNFQKRLKKQKATIELIRELYKTSKSRERGLIVIIDEFGKHLEFAANNNPESELYKFQELAEYINHPEKNILLIVTLHQGFDTYAHKLSKNQRYEWEKVRGRLKEITFNEPVEQLLYLAAEHLSNNKTVPDSFDELNNVILKSGTFPFKNSLSKKEIKKLYPLDLLSSAVVTISLQRYGQNERSLFTFLNSSDPLGINAFEHSNSYYNIANVYDYLVYNFYSLLSSRYNPDFVAWEIIKSVIERSSALFGEEFNDVSKLIKTIGLMNIFTSKGSKINLHLLITYGSSALGISNVEELVSLLQKNKLIKYQGFRDSFILFEGSDLDIENMLIDAASKVSPPENVAALINERIDLPVMLAKRAYFKTGVPRYFEFIISNEPIDKTPTDEIDGIINLIFNETLSDEEVLSHPGTSNEAIIFGKANNVENIKNVLYEIEKATIVLRNIENDQVASRELKKIISFHENELFQTLTTTVYDSKENISWFFKGNRIKIDSRDTFNKIISSVCEETYYSCPVYDNELINKQKLSSAISKARRVLVDRLINNYHENNLGFENTYPPEKTIYLSLLKNTGIHRNIDGVLTLTKPTDETFAPLWDACEEFFESSKTAKRNVQDLFDTLQKRPFKLKKGFLDFWITIWLIIKQNDLALFKDEQFQPSINNETLDVILKKPSNYFIKAFDLGGIKLNLFNKYRAVANLEHDINPTTSSFVETIRPFLKFYKELPEYTKTTKNLSIEATSLRQAIKSAKDPEQTFFTDLPNALRFTTNELIESQDSLKKYIRDLHSKIDELKLCYLNLIDRIEKEFISAFGLKANKFPNYKEELQRKYSKIKTHLFNDFQSVFYQRLYSKLNDRDSWLASIIQPMLNKKLEQIEDKEEKIIYEKFIELRTEFDNLLEFSNLALANNQRDATKIQISSLSSENIDELLTFTDEEIESASKIKDRLRKELAANKHQNIIALIKLLKEELNGK